MPGRRLAQASRLPAPQPTRMAQAPRCLAPQRRKHMSSSRRASASRRGHPRRTISVFAPMRATTHCDDRKDSIRSQTRVGSLTSTVTAAVTPRELPQAKRVPLTFVRNGQPSRAPQRTPSLDRHPRRSTGTRRLLAAPKDAGNPYVRELELEFSCGVAAERVSLAVSPGDPVRDREPCRAGRAPASSGERSGPHCLSAPRAKSPSGSPSGCRAGVGQRGGEAARGKIRPHRVPQLALS